MKRNCRSKAVVVRGQMFTPGIDQHVSMLHFVLEKKENICALNSSFFLLVLLNKLNIMPPTSAIIQYCNVEILPEYCNI